MLKISAKVNGVTPNGGAKCRLGRLKLATFDEHLSVIQKHRPSRVLST